MTERNTAKEKLKTLKRQTNRKIRQIHRQLSRKEKKKFSNSEKV